MLFCCDLPIERVIEVKLPQPTLSAALQNVCSPSGEFRRQRKREADEWCGRREKVPDDENSPEDRADQPSTQSSKPPALSKVAEKLRRNQATSRPGKTAKLLRHPTYPNVARITVPVSVSNQPSKEPPGCISLGYRLVGRQANVYASVAGSLEEASNRMSAVLLGGSCSHFARAVGGDTGSSADSGRGGPDAARRVGATPWAIARGISRSQTMEIAEQWRGVLHPPSHHFPFLWSDPSGGSGKSTRGGGMIETCRSCATLPLEVSLKSSFACGQPPLQEVFVRFAVREECATENPVYN